MIRPRTPAIAGGASGGPHRPPTSRHCRWGEFWLAVLLWFVSSPVSGDIIHLRNGNQIQGEVIKRGDRSVTVRFPGGSLDIPVRDIVRIQEESRLTYLLSEGEKHLKRREFEGAVSYLESAIEEFPESRRPRTRLLEARSRQARYLLENRFLEEARDVYRILLESPQDHRDARDRIAHIDRELARAVEEENRALRELASGSAAAAHARLRRLHEEFPDRRERISPSLARALVLLGHGELEKGNLERAESRYMEAITLSPDLVPGIEAPYVSLKIRQLKPLIDLGEFDQLLGRSEDALEIVPSNPVLNYFRGLALEGQGHWKEAAEVYLRITGLERPGNLKRSLDLLRRSVEAVILGRDPAELASAREEVLPGSWRRINTEHFAIYHRNHAVGKQVALVAEATYRRLYRELRLKTHWYKPCQIYIHPTREQFLSLSRGHDWIGGFHTIDSAGGILLEHRIESFQTQPRLAQTVIPHEIAHAMLEHRLRYRGHIPIWLTEGFAAWVEPEFVKRHHRRIVRHGRKAGKLMKVTELVRSRTYPDKEKVKYFYAQSFSLCELLITERGLDTFVAFLEELILSPDSLGLLLKRHYKLSGPVALENYWLGGLARQ